MRRPCAERSTCPRTSRLPDLIEDLISFIHRTDVDLLVQTAIAHAQFETIHPFSDGNGRTGRALAHAMLRRYGVTRRLTVPVSAGLLAKVESYYEALDAFRRGDLNRIVDAFAAAAFSACVNGRILVGELQGLLSEWTGRITARSHAAVWRVLPVLISQPRYSGRREFGG